MMGIAFSLLALGASDIVAGGLAGQPTRGSRIVLGAIVTAAVMLGHCLTARWSAASVVLALGVVAATAAWQILRMGTPSERRAAAAATLLLVLLTAVVLVAPLASGTEPRALARYLARSPIPLLAESAVDRLLAGLALVTLLVATANGFVRTVLRASGTRLEASEATLRGGRLIGVIERWLIFFLVAGGAPTAAALVVSAKSLVRFPELSSARPSVPVEPVGPREIDYVTEYFLLGSLLSWGVAVVAVSVLP